MIDYLQSNYHPSCSDYLRTILRSPIYEIAKVTPLQKMEKISLIFNNIIMVKREDYQPVHSFKLRGAYTMITNLNKAQRSKGIITASAGNHAQGVVLSAAKLSIKSLIVMPLSTSDIKINSVRSLNGKVFLYGMNFDEAQIKAIELSKKNGYVFIPPFDHPLIIAGQATLAMELLQQDAHIDRIFVPVGGGGLISGILILIKNLMPQIKIIAVEAEDSACLKAALKIGKPINLSRVGLFAEGVAVKKIGNENFRICKKYLDDNIIVDNDSICAAMKDLFEDTRAIAEPSGALALAGLKQYVKKHNIKNERLVHILSGANLNFHSLRYVSERCELGEKKEVLLAVTIPEKKGSFLKFCTKLGDRFITEFNYRYSNKEYAYVFVGIRLINGIQERIDIISKLSKSNYKVIDLSDDEMAKSHIRYMVGGRPFKSLRERVFSFEFPESPKALLIFLQKLGSYWNISLFHYRNHGNDYGKVLAAFELQNKEKLFEKYLLELGYHFYEETNNSAFRFFLADN